MGKKDRKRRETPPPLPVERNHDEHTPRFCLHHIQQGFDVKSLTQDAQAAFAQTIQERCSLSWSAIKRAPRHGLGTENIPKGKIRPSIPAAFQDREHFLVFRYHGMLPMVGVRTTDTFHVLWIEASFGDVYNHGS